MLHQVLVHKLVQLVCLLLLGLVLLVTQAKPSSVIVGEVVKSSLRCANRYPPPLGFGADQFLRRLGVAVPE